MIRTSCLFVLFLTCCLGSAIAQGGKPAPMLYMPANQMVSRSVFIYATHVDQMSDLRVSLRGSWGDTWSLPKSKVERVPDQSFKIGAVTTKATLFLCDFSETDFGSRKSRLRVQPVLHAGPDDKPTTVAIGEELVAIGRPRYATVWTVLMLITVLGSVVVMARLVRGHRHAWKYLLAGADGRMSLAKTQVAVFTIAIAGVVFGYGLLTSTAPDLPPELLYLMGISLTTSGVSSYIDRPSVAAQSVSIAAANGLDAPEVSEKPRVPRLRDLIMIQVGDNERLSIARAQMLAWTVVTVSLFVSCTIVDDKLWEVPYALVVLMGISGAGYLGAKIEPPKKITYPASNRFKVGDTVKLVPITEGGVVDSFGIDPALPDGLLFDSTTGEVRGQPEVESPAATYTVTAKGKTGEVSTQFRLAIESAEPA